MSFAREGLPLIAIAALVTAATYALALNRRSWPLWLVAFAFTISSLWIAYFFSDPRQPRSRGLRAIPVSDTATPHVLGRVADVRGPGHRRSIPFISSQSTVLVDRYRVSVR